MLDFFYFIIGVTFLLSVIALAVAGIALRNTRPKKIASKGNNDELSKLIDAFFYPSKEGPVRVPEYRTSTKTTTVTTGPAKKRRVLAPDLMDQNVYDDLIAAGKSERIARAKAKAAYIRAQKRDST